MGPRVAYARSRAGTAVASGAAAAAAAITCGGFAVTSISPAGPGQPAGPGLAASAVTGKANGHAASDAPHSTASSAGTGLAGSPGAQQRVWIDLVRVTSAQPGAAVSYLVRVAPPRALTRSVTVAAGARPAGVTVAIGCADARGRGAARSVRGREPFGRPGRRAGARRRRTLQYCLRPYCLRPYCLRPSSMLSAMTLLAIQPPGVGLRGIVRTGPQRPGRQFRGILGTGKQVPGRRLRGIARTGHQHPGRRFRGIVAPAEQPLTTAQGRRSRRALLARPPAWLPPLTRLSRSGYLIESRRGSLSSSSSGWRNRRERTRPARRGSPPAPRTGQAAARTSSLPRSHFLSLARQAGHFIGRTGRSGPGQGRTRALARPPGPAQAPARAQVPVPVPWDSYLGRAVSPQIQPRKRATGPNLLRQAHSAYGRGRTRAGRAAPAARQRAPAGRKGARQARCRVPACRGASRLRGFPAVSRKPTCIRCRSPRCRSPRCLNLRCLNLRCRNPRCRSPRCLSPRCLNSRCLNSRCRSEPFRPTLPLLCPGFRHNRGRARHRPCRRRLCRSQPQERTCHPGCRPRSTPRAEANCPRRSASRRPRSSASRRPRSSASCSR